MKQTFFFLAPSFLWASKAALDRSMFATISKVRVIFRGTMNFRGKMTLRPTYDVDQESLTMIVPAKEVGVSLELASEEEPSLQRCVIHPHLNIIVIHNSSESFD